MVSIDFTKKWDISDVALKMKDSEDPLYVNKAILAIYSPFFNTLFFGEFSESNQEVVKLDGIDYWPMLEILKIIHNVNRRFDEAAPNYPPQKFAQLWKTAEGYDILLIRRFCKQQLSRFTPPDALEAAILCEFHEEKSRMLNNMTADNIRIYLSKGGNELVFSTKDAATMVTKFLPPGTGINFPHIVHYNLYKPDPDMVSRRIDFAKKWEMSDIALEMKDGEILFTNKAILAIHSPFFKTLFFAGSVEPKQEVVELKDIDMKRMVLILDILHHVDRCFEKATPLFSVDDLVQFWKIANNYDIPLIRELCMQQIPQLSPENGLETVIKSGLHEEKSKILKKMSLQDLQKYLAKGITDLAFTPADAAVIGEKYRDTFCSNCKGAL